MLRALISSWSFTGRTKEQNQAFSQRASSQTEDSPLTQADTALSTPKQLHELHQPPIYTVISTFYITAKDLRDIKCLSFPLLFSFSFLLLLQWRVSLNNATNLRNKERKPQDLNLGSAVNANKPGWINLGRECLSMPGATANCPTCLPWPETLQYLWPPLVQTPCAIKKADDYWNPLVWPSMPLTAQVWMHWASIGREEKIYIHSDQPKCSLHHFNDALNVSRILLLVSTTLKTKAHTVCSRAGACH